MGNKGCSKEWLENYILEPPIFHRFKLMANVKVEKRTATIL